MFNFKGPEANSNNYWVKCTSKKFGGMFYYYNTRTKLSVWNLSDLAISSKDINIQQIPNVPFINKEPLNPPNLFGKVPQLSINNPLKVNAGTNIRPLLYPNRIVSNPKLWDSSSNQSKINSKQFATTGTQTSDIYLNLQCATPLRKQILKEPKLFGSIKKDVSTNTVYLNNIFEHGFKAITNLTNGSSHFSSNTKKSRTSSSATDVENCASGDIIDIDIQDLNIKDYNSAVTCTKDDSASSTNSLAVTDLRHIITGRRKTKTYHDLELFANDKESVKDIFITGPFKDKIRNINETSEESPNENVMQNKPNAWNLAHLKDLAAPDQMTSPWYLVVDTNMILLELDFVTNLLKSNPDCKLRIPDIVQKQLRNLSVNKLTESSLIIAARRAIRYLANNSSVDMIQTNSQFSEKKEVEQSDVIDNVIKCCMQIKNTDHFLIVLSDNEILKKKLNLLGIDCYSKDKLKEIMENKSKSSNLQNKRNVTRKRPFEPTTVSGIESKRMCTENLPKNTAGTFINNNNKLFKDFISCKDHTIPMSTLFQNKPIGNNIMQIVGGARKKVTETQSKKEPPATFDLTFKSLAEKYNSESLQQNPSMFKIANKVIENKLKLRMDEWLCRFVQVMEETLIQVLQGFSAVFTCPPSLTLQEAVAIVHKLHKNNETVDKYCNNFSNLLSALNDADGKFNKDLTPNKFMEIFASGYQLVELLLDLEKNDIGLDCGIKYLKELLDEINDPAVEIDIYAFDSDIDPTNYTEDVPNTKKKPASSGNKVSTSTENIVVQVTNEGIPKTASGDKFFQQVSSTPIPKQNVINNDGNNCKTIRSVAKNDNIEENIKCPQLQHAAFITKDSKQPAIENEEAALDANVQVAFVFQKFFVEIETTFISIENFIKETKKRITTMDNNKKKQSGHNLSQIYVILLNIIKSLKQIMYRDRFEDDNIRRLIAKVIPTQEINDDIIMDYSEKVVKYLDQAALLENSLNELLTCLKTGAI